MRAEIIAVGTELLIGQIVNTNARYISRKLNDFGVSVYHHSVVGDNSERIKEIFGAALKRSDLVVITGGLGPTEDDLTKEAVCEFLGVDLIPDDDILDGIERYFRSRNIDMAKSNKKQAYVPEGACILHNMKGTAPGFYIRHENKGIVILPGPPIEMEPMFEYFLSRYLSRDNIIYSKYVSIFGIGESAVEERILDLIHRYDRITLATYANIGQVVIRVTTSAINKTEAEQQMKEVTDALHLRFGDNIFSDKDISLPEAVADLLIKKSRTVAVAESCTGGMISKYLTDIPGASAYFPGSVVPYSNDAKNKVLGIQSALIKDSGAVSGKVCGLMAKSISELMNADIGLSVTGIAGPGGGNAEKPVGTVYIGIFNGEEIKVKRHIFNGDRNKIRTMTAMTALDMLRRELI